MSIQEELKNKKPIFGFDVAAKKMKTGEINVVYYSSNCINKNRLDLLSKTTKVKVEELKENSKQLGSICKKPFAISVVSFK